MANLWSALVVTVIGMGVIFIVLTLLLFTILALNKAFPFKTPEPSPAKPAGGDDSETVAVIQAAIASYLKRRPDEISIKSIK